MFLPPRNIQTNRMVRVKFIKSYQTKQAKVSAVNVVQSDVGNKENRTHLVWE